MNNFLVLSLQILLFYTAYITGVSSRNIEEVCPLNERECVWSFYKDLRLFRREPVKVGHISTVTFENGRVGELKTLSIKPPIFEIRNFLSSEECDEIIAIAEKQGLQVSVTIGEDVDFEDKETFTEDLEKVFDVYDLNKDNLLNEDEVIQLFDSELDFSPEQEDIILLFKDYGLDKNEDRLLSREEFLHMGVENFIKFITVTRQEKPYTKARHSKQTWLNVEDDSPQVLHNIQKRVQILTELPMALINSSESIQVVSYGPRGHYNCHLDSDHIDENPTCCQHSKYDENCRICRYLTVLYFLNDVEEGGETAFPVADNKTLNEDVLDHDPERRCNVGRFCNKSNLRVKPEKGKAIFWYNHVVNDSTGWLGHADPYSLHGGCDVIKGKKWVANTWLAVSENRTKDLEFWTETMFGINDSPEENNDVIDEILMSVEGREKYGDDLILDEIKALNHD